MTRQEIATALDISPTFVQESIRGLRMRRVIITTVRGEGRKGRNQYELNSKGRLEGRFTG
jgi:biotin operon repressor